MGLTCASLHVYSRETAAGAPSAHALAQAAGGRLGLDLTDNPEEAERQLIAVAVGPWLSFFDTTHPLIVTKESVELGKQLSATSGSPVLLTSVLDSDAFAFLLFEAGKQVDAHASGPGLLPGRMKKWAPQRRAAEWSRLFNRPIAPDDVETMTRKDVLFADDLLLRLCDLVGLSRELATATPDDLRVRPWPGQELFQLRSRPGTPGGLRVKQTVPNKDRTQSLPLGSNREHPIPFELNGPAGAFVDPVLEFTGSAVEAGVVELAGGYGLWALGIEAIRAGDIRRVTAEVSAEETEGARLLRARLKGLSADRFGFSPRKQSILIYWCTLRGLAPGTGEVRVECLPNASTGDRLALRPVFVVGA